jgi:AraC family transcriptional activator of pobA
VVSFSEDVATVLGESESAALARLHALAETPLLSFNRGEEVGRLAGFCRELLEEHFLVREGFEVAARAYLALIGVEVVRLATSRARSGAVTLAPADPVVAELRRLLEANFRAQRRIGFYAGTLAMTADRLNDHVKRATGVTAGHLLRQRVLTEAKRQLVFTDLAIGEIAYDLAFADPSHFGRFFKKQTGKTPQEFRAGKRA